MRIKQFICFQYIYFIVLQYFIILQLQFFGLDTETLPCLQIYNTKIKGFRYVFKYIMINNSRYIHTHIYIYIYTLLNIKEAKLIKQMLEFNIFIFIFHIYQNVNLFLYDQIT